jgi:hypothetical protein
MQPDSRQTNLQKIIAHNPIAMCLKIFSTYHSENEGILMHLQQ